MKKGIEKKRKTKSPKTNNTILQLITLKVKK